MRKNLLALMLVIGAVTYGQVGVGTSKPDASTMLDIVSHNKGILIPRVPLLSTVDIKTIDNSLV